MNRITLKRGREHSVLRGQLNGSRMDTAATARRPPENDIETSETIPLEGAAPSAPRGR